VADYTRFIILCSARSGSTMLSSALNSSSEIVCFRELFNAAVHFIDFDVEGYQRDSVEDRALRDKDFREFIERRIFCAHGEDVRAVGFKAMYDHIWVFEGLSEYLAAQPDIRVIHLQRRNPLRSFVSLRIAETSGNWVEPLLPPRAPWVPGPVRRAIRPFRRALSAIRHPALEPKAVTLSPEECRFYFSWAEEKTNEYGDQFREHPILTLYYEDLARHPRAELERVQRFLGLPPRSLPIGTLRQNPEPLRELLANYDELRETFAGTEFAVFFDG
jgi:hypothetical protein